MPRKEQGWITFQSSEEERRILEKYCQQCQRSKTEILRELVRSLDRHDDSQVPSSLPVESEVLTADRVESAVLHNVALSARNILRARIKRVIVAGVNAEVTLAIAPGIELVSAITRSSAERLQLTEGKEVYAVIKSSNVIIAAVEPNERR